MSIKILNRFTGDIIFECDSEDGSIRFAVNLAIKKKISLRGADLSGADLRSVDFRGADLRSVDFRGADFDGADFDGADIRDANLSGAKNADLIKAQTVIVPQGDLIGWKKLKNGIVAKLKIPESAKRSNAIGRKCRAEYVDVLEVIGAEFGISRNDGTTKYVVGERVTANSFDDDRFNECSTGIHFFITREEAEAYVL